MSDPKCELCENEGAGEVEFETGNNAEYAVMIVLCETHLKEEEDSGTSCAFEQKYAKQIEEALYESWRGMV